MAKDKDILHALIDYLVARGYPVQWIAIEYPAGKRNADLAVVDPATNEPVAVFELKRDRKPESEMSGRKQLAAFSTAMGNPSILAYLVFEKKGRPGFEIKRVGPNDGDPGKKPEDVPEFRVLQHSSRLTAVAGKKQEKEHALDVFLCISWACALLVLVVLVADLLGHGMSEKQLVLAGAVIALVLIPYANKLKILGFEWERLQKATKEQGEEHQE